MASELLQVTPDQLVTLGAMVSREWGDHGYRIEEIHSYSSMVTAARVRCADGGRFVVMSDRYGNTRSIQCENYDAEAWNSPPMFDMATDLDQRARVN